MAMFRALKKVRYGGRSLAPGDEFEILNPRDMKVLTAVRIAEVMPTEAETASVPPAVRRGRGRPRKNPRPETEGAATYARRDMVAEQP